MKIAVLFVRYGTNKYAGSERLLADFYDKNVPGIHHDLFIIDNALPGDRFEILGDQTVLLGGDNRNWEFSAWDRAIRFLGGKINSYDLVHFVTSAFHTLYTDYLDRFDHRSLVWSSRHRLALGHIDCYDEEIEILGNRSQHWLRSSFFFLPLPVLFQLNSLVTIQDPEVIFGADPGQPFRNNAPLSENYQQYLLDWLTGAGAQGVQWHSRFDLAAENFPFFKHKALAILNEHLLSIRIRSRAPMIDITWLSGIIRGGVRGCPDWDTPWQRQLSWRSG